LAVFGGLVLLNIFVEFNNHYYPTWYPLISFLLALVFIAGIVLFLIWTCTESAGTRTCLKIGGWLILGSILALVIWNVSFTLLYEHEHHVKVGSGDEDDDYDEESKGTYVMGYLLWGTVMVCLDVALLILAFQYDETFPDEDEEMMDDMMDDMMMEDKMDEEMMMAMEGEGMEGGALETLRSAKSIAALNRSNILNRSNLSKKSMASRSSSKKSVKSNPKSVKSVKSAKSIKSVKSVKSIKSANSSIKNIAAPPINVTTN
jgi:hypothetical protein